MEPLNLTAGSPTNTTAVRSKSGVIALLGPCAGVLCLIHCFGMALVSIFAPSLLAFLPHSDLAEAGILLFSASIGFWSLQRLSAPRKLLWGFAGVAVMGAVGLSLHQHSIFRASLGGVAVIQILTMLRHHRLTRRDHPDCCEVSPKV